MLTDMTVLKPESACSGDAVIATRDDATPLCLRPLNAYPDLLRTQQFLDDSRTKLVTEMTGLSFKNINNEDLKAMMAETKEDSILPHEYRKQ